jgi:hypothetical protein
MGGDEEEESLSTMRAAAGCIASWMMTDNNVEMDVDAIENALLDDGGLIPSKSECQDFVCGGETGEVPSDLSDRYPKTHALLDEQCT